MNRANFKFLLKWHSHFEIAICYQSSTNRAVRSKNSSRSFHFPPPTFSLDSWKHRGDTESILCDRIYLRANSFFSPVCYFPCIQISATSILVRHQIRYKYSPIRNACRMAENIVKGYYSNTCFFFFFFVKCATLFRKILSINILHCNNYLVRTEQFF